MSKAHLLYGFVVDATADNCPKACDPEVWLDDPVAAIQNLVGTRLGVTALWGNYHLDRIVVHVVGLSVDEGCAEKTGRLPVLPSLVEALDEARRRLGLGPIEAPIDWYIACEGSI